MAPLVLTHGHVSGRVLIPSSKVGHRTVGSSSTGGITGYLEAKCPTSWTLGAALTWQLFARVLCVCVFVVFLLCVFVFVCFCFCVSVSGGGTPKSEVAFSESLIAQPNLHEPTCTRKIALPNLHEPTCTRKIALQN